MTAEEAIKTIAEHCDRNIEQVTPEATLILDLGIDSLDTMELLIKLEMESERDIDFNTDEFYYLTVGYLVDAVTTPNNAV